MHFYRLINDDIDSLQYTCTALLGGGGKTALLHKLANEFSEFNPKVLQTSLTKTAFYKSENPLILSDINVIKSAKRNPLFVIGDKINDNKLLGISEVQLNEIRKLFDVTIFECDGAKNKPLKAHTDHDPTVPKFSTNVIIIIGADVVNTKIQDGLVHRTELFCKLWNADINTKLDIEFIVKVVSSKRGYLSKVPDDVSVTYFINKADIYNENARKLALGIFNDTGNPTFYGSIRNNLLERVQ